MLRGGGGCSFLVGGCEVGLSLGPARGSARFVRGVEFVMILEEGKRHFGWMKGAGWDCHVLRVEGGVAASVEQRNVLNEI